MGKLTLEQMDAIVDKVTAMHMGQGLQNMTLDERKDFLSCAVMQSILLLRAVAGEQHTYNLLQGGIQDIKAPNVLLRQVIH